MGKSPRLATGEDAKHESYASGDRHCGQGILPDRFLSLFSLFQRHILGATNLLVGRALQRCGQVLHVGADGFDLLGQVLGGGA